MFNDYYKNELTILKSLGKEFAKEHPILAQTLNSPSANADVERLLEGVAFLTAQINKKLDDEFPEILHSLMHTVCPQYLSPTPSATIIAFSPKSNLNETIRISSGTYIDSFPVDNTACRFRTCFDVCVSPVQITNAEFINSNSDDRNNDRMELHLDFELLGISLDQWNNDKMRIYINGEYSEASNIYFLLHHYLKKITINTTEETPPFSLGAKRLSPVGFEKDSLLPYPTNVFPSFRVLQEYFMLPEKFLFIDLDLKCWQDRGSGNSFSISFICSVPPITLPKISSDNFVLFAVPAINLFEQDAEPVLYDHSEHEIQIRPAGMHRGSHQIYSVDKVSGIKKGDSQNRQFASFNDFDPKTQEVPVYQSAFRPSILENSMDLFIALAYPPDSPLPSSEIISAELTCTNGTLPDVLMEGDICKPTSNTPELVHYKNIIPPTKSQPPPQEKKLLPYLLSHLSMNYLSFADAGCLKSLLQHYLFSSGRHKKKELTNIRRINSILSVEISPHEQIINRAVLRGQAIRIKIKNDHFDSLGDMYLFGTILDYFLGTYASINTCTSLTFDDVMRGEHIKWPTRLGTRPLI